MPSDGLMFDNQLAALRRFINSHYLVSAVRQSMGVLVVFLLVAAFTHTTTAAVAALGATYVALIDRPTRLRERLREMLAGALLGALAVSLTGLVLDKPLALLIVMTLQAFFFSMLAVYGSRGATIGLACLTLSIITMPAGLTPDNVLGYSLVSVSGALLYILYSILSGRLLRLPEERQCLAVALYATAQYLIARARLYEAGVSIDVGYQQLVGAQANMIIAQQGTRDSALGYMSMGSVQRSRAQLMVWNLMVDMANLVDLVISTHTDYRLLHSKTQSAAALVCMRDALGQMSVTLEGIATAVARQTRLSPSPDIRRTLRRLAAEIDAMQQGGVAKEEPHLFAVCITIHRRLERMNEILQRMVSQTDCQRPASPLNAALLAMSLTSFMSGQSFSPRLFLSNLRFDRAPFRFAVRVSIGMALAMLAGTLIPATGSHGYWIALTVIVIMKPAFALTKQRNAQRLAGTLMGCALTFALLHVTTEPVVLLGVFLVSLTLCFLFLVSTMYLAYSAAVSVTVLLMLHVLLPGSINLPAERAVDTLIGSIIALACSFVLPWWEARSLPSIALNAIRANERLLGATVAIVKGQVRDEADWQLARQNMQLTFSNFAQAVKRMMAEPLSRQVHVVQYSALVILVHMMAAEVIKLLMQAQERPDFAASVAPVLEQMVPAVQTLDPGAVPMLMQVEHALPQDTYALRQLEESTRDMLRTYAAVVTPCIGLKAKMRPR